MRNETRNVINQFVNNIFTPLFFVSIGMAVDFTSDFNLPITALILIIVFTGKIVGSFIAGKTSGMPKNEYLALGFAMSATGTMQIILGFIALQYAIINREIFTALVITAMVTSITAAPMLVLLLKIGSKMPIHEIFQRQLFMYIPESITSKEAIEMLSQKATHTSGLSGLHITEKVLARERIMSTGIGFGIAVPHAQLDGLQKPLIAVGISREGVDFNAPDGLPAHLIFLILTPGHDTNAQIQILAQIANIFLDERTRNAAIHAASFNEFIAVIKNAVFEKTKSS